MQNAPQESSTDNSSKDKVNVQHHHHDIGHSSTPQSATSNSSPAKSETETFSEHRRYMSDSSESEEDSVSEEFEEDPQVDVAKFLLSPESERGNVDPETQARLEALLQAAGIGQLASKDGKHLADPEVLRRLTSSVSCALDEAAAALTRMRSDNPRSQPEKTSLVEACTDGDVGTVRKLLTEGRSVHETSEEGESLLSLACSAGYFELAQVLLAMHANVEDRGIKGECTPLMEAASSGHLDIVRLLVAHGADVNAQSTSGNTPLMYGCAGGHTEVVKFLLENGANVEDHNENGHTPLMEAASAGHVGLAKILLMHGAGINTHSNEFKESALTLACYKGHLDMVRFLLEAGADQEHKTDEMHTALMEASMDGHVEVARLLLDSGAQVNMPTDSFESPLTLAACGGHVDLAMLLIERGANIEEVNDEGYTPLMEAAREGHEEMVHLLLGQGANINAQTDETQETALTLACCGGFTEVADVLLKGGADIELGASTPLMEAAQEGHLDLVRFLLENGANVHAQTQTGDTALTYACENGHTDVADLLLQYGADLEHESEGGRTPLMKACRAGHLCTVQFLISKGANVRRQTTNNDHTPLSLACAGGHLAVVELLLAHNADPNHKLKDNSTMLIEAAKGGHTSVVQLLLDYPHSLQSLMMNQQQQGAATATNLSMLPGQVGSRESPLPPGPVVPAVPIQSVGYYQQTTAAILQEAPEASRAVSQEESMPGLAEINKQQVSALSRNTDSQSSKNRKSLPKSRSTSAVFDSNLTSAEAQQVRTQPLAGGGEFDEDMLATSTIGLIGDDGSSQKQQILEELHRVERELHGKQQQQTHNHIFQYGISQDQIPVSAATTTLPHMVNIDIAMQQPTLGSAMPSSVFSGNLQVPSFYPAETVSCLQTPPSVKITDSGTFTASQTPPAFYFAPISSSVAVSLPTATSTATSQPSKFVTTHTEVSQNTAINDRPKAKPVSKKEGKNIRKQQQQQQSSQQQQQQNQQTQQQQQQQQYQTNLYSQHSPQIFSPAQLQQLQQQQQQQVEKTLSIQETLNVQDIDFDVLDQDCLTASLLQQFHSSSAPIRTAALVGSPVQPYTGTMEDSMMASLTSQPELTSQSELSRVDYFVPANGAPVAQVAQVAQVPMHLYPYDYLAAAGLSNKEQSGAIYQAGFQAGINLMQQQLGCPPGSTSDTITSTTVVPTTVTSMGTSTQHQYITSQVQPSCTGIQQQTANAIVTSTQPVQQQTAHHCPVPCTQHQQQLVQQSHHQQQQQPQATHQVQAATQTPQTANITSDSKNKNKTVVESVKVKKGRAPRQQQQPQAQQQNLQQQQQQQSQQQQNNQGNNNSHNQNIYQIDHNSAITQYSGGNQQCATPIVQPAPVLDVDSETESNHDTALTLACAGGHEELVQLLIQRAADIEHRDKKGFTPLILAATAGHEKVVQILLDNNADIEAQSERTKDTPLSLACSGGRYEVVELLLKRNANKEHRNVSDYTPLSLAASGGYVNIIKLLLQHGAEINSRTGSKLGISPLMLAAMNGHTAAVKLLLDMGSDINAQIETNRNTALTLACFQGRHEVVSLLLDRKANVEHRAKTGLTPLMEAASGGYVEVGRVLLDKGADVNATPVPSSRDTALTIAADKGHVRFVELLLCRGAQIEVKNKKGNSPLWLAANGGHLAVVELLYNVNADIDSQDNRKVSCLMAAFRKGHVKVVKWMVNHVTQFPSDQEMIRYISTISDKELLEKCQECIKVIRSAKETQAAKANKNASILLEELDMEKTREESKRLAAARRRERKKKKKLEKKEERRKLLEENKKNETYDEKEKRDGTEDDEKVEDEETLQEQTIESTIRTSDVADKEEGDSGIDANSQGSCSSNDIKTKEKRKEKKKKKGNKNKDNSNDRNNEKSVTSSSKSTDYHEVAEKRSEKSEGKNSKSNRNSILKNLVFEATKSPADRDDFEATGNENIFTSYSKSTRCHNESINQSLKNSSASPKQSTKREEGWKEVVRKSSVQTVSTSESGVKKVTVPSNAISRVIGRGGSNINAIRGATGAHIEVEKQMKGQGERTITIKGSSEATKQAYSLIAALIKDPDVDILQILSKTSKTVSSTTTLWDKTQIGTKKASGKVPNVSQPTSTQAKPIANATTVTSTRAVASSVKTRSSAAVISSRATAPRLAAQAEKNAAAQAAVAARTLPPHTTSASAVNRIPAKVMTTTTSQTFAAKLTETSQMSVGIPVNKPRSLGVPQGSVGPVSPQSVTNSANIQSSPVKHNSRPTPTASAPPTMQHYQNQGKAQMYNMSQNVKAASVADQAGTSANLTRSTTPNQIQSSTVTGQEESHNQPNVAAHSEYSLFYSTDQPMWRRENESQKPINFAAVTGGANSQVVNQTKFIDEEPPQVDAAKAPGYRGGAMCSPVSSKTSSSSTTPPNISTSGASSYSSYPENSKSQQLPPIGSNMSHNRPPVSQSNQNDISNNFLYTEMYKTGSLSNIPHSSMLNIATSDNQLLQTSYLPPSSIQNMNFSQQQQANIPPVSMSRLNPKAPDFSSSVYNSYPKQAMYNGFPLNNDNMYQMPKGGVDNMHRSNLQHRWTMMHMQPPFPQPQPNDQLISGLSGLTITNIARTMEENNGELNIVNNSPNMSPNMASVHSMPTADNHYLDDRKPPQPIGTERARKVFPNVDPNRLMSNDSKMGRWSMAAANYTNRYTAKGQFDDLAMMDLQAHNMPLDPAHNYTNGPTIQQQQQQQPQQPQQQQQYLLQQQQQHVKYPTNFIELDPTKLDKHWEYSPYMNEIPDKGHGWINKWNQ